jgi:hypothetical protein
MMRGIVIACVLAAATCVSIPPYDPPIGVTWSDANHTIVGSNFSLHFGNQFAYPDSIILGTRELASHHATAACNVEDQVGMALYPEWRISANSDAPLDVNGVNGADVALYGPAVAKVQIHWATTLCGSEHKPAGYTSVTVFPDGRIARYDTIADPTATSLDPAICTCGAASNKWYVTSFWSFDASPFDAYRAGSGAMPLPLPGQVNSTSHVDCLQGTDGGMRAVAIAWDAGAPVLPRMNANTPDTVAFVQDHATPPDMLTSLDTGMTSMLLLRQGTDCAGLDGAMGDYMAAPPLVINNNSVMRSKDGIYGGDDLGSGGGYSVQGTTTIAGQINTPFAVWLTFPNPNTGLRVSRAPARTGAWYVPQQLSEYDWVLWFRDGLRDDQGTITIEPQ